jgi:predicted MPP superfamily phosphohydrolase
MAWITRRHFLRAGLMGVAAAGAAIGYAHYVEPGWLEVSSVEIALPRLPDAFANFTIAQISDLHFGPFGTPEQIQPTLDALQSLNADVIVITGDIVSRITQGELDMVVQALSRLHAREGVFAVLGNHDWWEGGLAVGEALRRAGVMLLSNRHHSIRRGSQALYFAGVDDVWCDKHDLAAALTGIPRNAAVVMLVHEPDFADTVAQESRAILQLSGHSHGGQLRVPGHGGLWFPPFARKYPMGLYQVNEMALYTNRGIGMVSRPMRFACRPEVTRFTLRPWA